MVKLLRLKGDTTQGELSKTEIRNTFREPILVKANSKIALAGLDVGFNNILNQQFTVAQGTSGLTLRLNKSVITLTPGTYSQQGLLAELASQARVFGAKGASSGSAIKLKVFGVDIDVTVDPIDTEKSRLKQTVFKVVDAGFDTQWEVVAGNAAFEAALTAGTYTGDAAVACQLISSYRVPNAKSRMTGVVNSTDRITFGVVDEEGTYAFGLEINGAGNYVTKFNGADSDTGVAAVVGDRFFIGRDEPNETVIVRVSASTGAGGAIKVNEPNNLTPAIWNTFLGEGPYFNVETPIGSAGSISAVKCTFNKAADSTASNFSLQFTNQLMATFFGYPTLGPFEIKGDDPAILTSPQHMIGERNFRGLMVNIDPFQLESYDGASDSVSRPNCLYVIHDLQSLSNEVNLDVPNLIKLDLRNDGDMTLNQIRITFRTSLDNTALQFSNNPIVTLLIFDPDE